MKIFLTGGSGFIGQNIIDHMSRSHEILAIHRKKIKKNRNIHTILGDLEDIKSYSNDLRKFKPDIVLHFAWSGVDGASRNQNIQINNIKSTINLFRLSEKIGVKKFIATGSQAEYGPRNIKINERFKMKPTTKYGKAKVDCFETIKKEFKNSKLIKNFIWLRVFSLYGPHDNPSWFLPYVILSLYKNQELNLTKCEQYWDYLYIKDFVKLVNKIMISNQSQYNAYNVGSGKPVKLKSVINRISKILNKKGIIKYGSIPYREDQVMHMEADINRVCEEFRWQPQFRFNKNLEETIEWFINKY